VSSRPAAAAAFAIPDLAALVFSAYCSGIRFDFHPPAAGDLSAIIEATKSYVLTLSLGFDRKELVRIPPIPDIAEWEAFERTRGFWLTDAAINPARPCSVKT
jgi:hypothetical protein